MFRKVHGDAATELLQASKGWNSGPVLRPPAYTVPTWLMVAAQLVKTLGRVVWFCLRHPLPTGATVSGVFLYVRYGWPALVSAAASLAVLLGVWALAHLPSFLRLVGLPVLARWRWLVVYRRHWQPAMTITGLSRTFHHQEYLPQVRKIRCTSRQDRLLVQMVTGQAPDAWEKAAAQLAHTFGAASCVIRSDKPGRIWVEFTRGDPLAQTIPALPVPQVANLKAVPLGHQADGRTWTLNLLGASVLIAGAQGAGKGSVLWSLVRGVAGAVRSGLVQVWAIDPKGGMELTPGQELFTRFEYRYWQPHTIADLLEEAVSVMQDRIERLRGKTRLHQPTEDEPLILVLVDEMAALTAYLQDRDARKRITQALSVLASQGRAVGVVTVAALQDPRKDVLSFRDLFTTRIALRLVEDEQVSMVLGDGARDRGAVCDRIPKSTPGVGYVLLDGDREPTRVRAAYVDDPDIHEMAAEHAPARDGLTLVHTGTETAEGGEAS